MVTNSANAPSEGMLWGGRFTGGIDPLMHQYNASISYDKLLYKEDIRGSIAFARANAKSGIISNGEFAEIERGLQEVLKEWDAETFIIMPHDEDIHTANERRLGEIIGKDIAGKLHTGRSRNEQVVCDMRMWLRERIREIDSHLVAFLQVIIARAEDEIDHIMPGYTHLQRAMAVRFSAWLLSFGFAFASDLERLRETFKRVNQSPLGCGALAGNAFNIDRDMMAEELGFNGILWNSMAAVSSRDFVTEFLQWGSMFMGHVSNWSQDLILYSSSEFGFVTIADAYSTGSSLMPQKKNPDGLELLRGKSGRCFGHLAGFMMTNKALPSTYNKDLQESWEPMLDHVKTISDSLQIANGVLSTLSIRSERMLAALDPTLLATDIADFLVRKGVPFRETHHVSGRVVAKSEELGVPIDQLSLEQLKAIDDRFTDDIMDIFNYEKSVESRSAKGGTSRSSILEQIKVLRALLS
ncbi:Argininosuccinate lyase [Metarhizium rileyi]|uniref:argininosuccinate lyase n=1 Tax=Metarhizium rileyi (strain RCEF 4871) TaxID=1649241 RepID=A0A162JHP1_METRR|nr:Argininosuccinate lyase [Metarhizium rileyi RCEF 4871]TWU72504.1 argininosuccinate lyase [Metarhizium rileyi]